VKIINNNQIIRLDSVFNDLDERKIIDSTGYQERIPWTDYSIPIRQEATVSPKNVIYISRLEFIKFTVAFVIRRKQPKLSYEKQFHYFKNYEQLFTFLAYTGSFPDVSNPDQEVISMQLCGEAEYFVNLDSGGIFYAVSGNDRMGATPVMNLMPEFKSPIYVTESIPGAQTEAYTLPDNRGSLEIGLRDLQPEKTRRSDIEDIIIEFGKYCGEYIKTNIEHFAKKYIYTEEAAKKFADGLRYSYEDQRR